MIKKITFNKKKFKKEVEANTRILFRRTLEEATPAADLSGSGLFHQRRYYR